MLSTLSSLFRRAHRTRKSSTALVALESRRLLAGAYGTVDTSFGANGLASISLNGTPIPIGMNDIASVPGGGYRVLISPPSRDIVVGITETGVLDTTFGNGGFLDVQLAGIDSNFNSLTIQSDGKLILAGAATTTDITRFDDDFIFARFQANGQLDTTFGEGGFTLVDVSFASDDYEINSVGVTPDGHIFGAGTWRGGVDQGALVYLTATGDLDTSFGETGGQFTGAGVSTFGFQFRSWFAKYDAQNTRLVVTGDEVRAGSTWISTYQFLTNGTLDIDFGTGNIGNELIGEGGKSFSVQGMDVNGPWIYVSGYWYNQSTNESKDIVARMHRGPGTPTGHNGDWDKNYGVNGLQEVSILNPEVVAEPDGGVIVGGFPNAPGNILPTEMAIERRLESGELDTSFGTGGKTKVNLTGETGYVAGRFTRDLAGRLVLVGLPTGANKPMYLGRFNGEQPADYDDVLSYDAATGQWRLGISDGGAFTNVLGPQWNSALGFDTYTGDFNADGLTDLAGRTDSGAWHIGINNGNQTFTTTPWGQWTADATAGWSNVAIGDFNNDGRADIVGQDNQRNIVVAISNGSTLTTTQWGTLGTAFIGHTVGDFNGDGRSDIAHLNSSGAWWVSESNGTQFVLDQYATVLSHSKKGWRNIMTGDFNGDDVDDVLFQDKQGNWHIGSGTTAVDGKFTVVKANRWKPTGYVEYHVADFTGDGRDDLLGRNVKNEWWVNTSLSSGLMKAKYWGGSGATNTISSAVGDFNGDGRADVAALIHSSKNWSTLLSQTNSTFLADPFGSWTGWNGGVLRKAELN